MFHRLILLSTVQTPNHICSEFNPKLQQFKQKNKKKKTKLIHHKFKHCVFFRIFSNPSKDHTKIKNKKEVKKGVEKKWDLEHRSNPCRHERSHGIPPAPGGGSASPLRYLRCSSCPLVLLQPQFTRSNKRVQSVALESLYSRERYRIRYRIRV